MVQRTKPLILAIIFTMSEKAMNCEYAVKNRSSHPSDSETLEYLHRERLTKDQLILTHLTRFAADKIRVLRGRSAHELSKSTVLVINAVSLPGNASMVVMRRPQQNSITNTAESSLTLFENYSNLADSALCRKPL